MSYTPAFFFFFHEGKIVGHNLKTQKYYEIDSETFASLKSLSSGNKEALSKEQLSRLQDSGFDEIGMNVAWEGDTPSYVAHQSSRIVSQNTPVLTKEEFVDQYSQMSEGISSIPEKERPQGEVVNLPDPSLSALDEVSLGQCFRDRKTSREFNKGSIELEQLSTILYSCFGPIHGKNHDEFIRLGLRDLVRRRSSPSATGLASCDAIIYVHNVNSLEPGVYSYHEMDHTLIKHAKGINEKELVYGLFDQFWVENVAAGIFIINDMRLTWVKDLKNRGYLSSLMEAGHVSQNLLLSGTACGLQTWISGAFRDDFLAKKFDLPEYRFPSLFIGIGHGSGRALPQDYIDLLEKRG